MGELTGMRKGIEKTDMKERYTERLRGRKAARQTEKGETVEKTLRALEGISQLRGHYVSVHRI